MVMKRFALVAVVAVIVSGVLLFVNLRNSSPSANVLALRCSESVGQQQRGGESVVGGVEGLVLPGSSDPASLRPLRSASGQRFFVYKAFLAVSALAGPNATVSIVRPQSARMYYGSPTQVGTLADREQGRGLIEASKSQVRLPVCGSDFTGFVGGIIVMKPTSVTFAVSSPNLKTERVTIDIGDG
jgi:hypothetical protein